jgi:ribosome-associated protein
MTKLETRRMILAAAAACEEKKAEHVQILELDPADSGFTDYFLICSGANERQNQTIATAIEDRLEKDFGTRVNSIEGYRQGDWILMDYVDFVVHIFSPEKREFYDIARLRKTATSVGLAQLKAGLKAKTAAARKASPVKKTAAKKIVKTPKRAAKALKKPSAKKMVAKKVAKKSVPKKASRKNS